MSRDRLSQFSHNPLKLMVQNRTQSFNASRLSCVTINLQHIHPDHDMTGGDLLINTSCPAPCTVDVHGWLTLRDVSPAALASQFWNSAHSGKHLPD